MKKLNSKDVRTTLAHDSVSRKALIETGDLESSVQTLNEAWLEKDGQVEAHSHDDCEEIYYFLDGKGTMSVNDEVFEVGKGEMVVVEAGDVHSLKNTGSEKLLFLTIRALVS